MTSLQICEALAALNLKEEELDDLELLDKQCKIFIEKLRWHRQELATPPGALVSPPERFSIY
jgi:hypothetical protein